MIVQDVTKSYRPIVALHGVSLIASGGVFLAVTGSSGFGKSTLLNLIGTLDRPDSGTIWVGGKPAPSPRVAVEFRRRLVGFVFQDHLLLPYISAQRTSRRPCWLRASPATSARGALRISATIGRSAQGRTA